MDAHAQATDVLSVDRAGALAQPQAVAEDLRPANAFRINEAVEGIEAQKTGLELRLRPNRLDGSGTAIYERSVGARAPVAGPALGASGEGILPAIRGRDALDTSWGYGSGASGSAERALPLAATSAGRRARFVLAIWIASMIADFMLDGLAWLRPTISNAVP